MNRAAKAESLEQLRQTFAGAGIVVVARYSGLTVAEFSDLRRRLKAEDARVRVVKNRLARMALNTGPGEAVGALFSGPVAIAWSTDPVTAPRITVDFAADNENFAIVGGFLGEEMLDRAKLEALAKLPTLEQLRGRLVGLVQAPATKLAGLLQAPAGQLARLQAARAAEPEAG